MSSENVIEKVIQLLNNYEDGLGEIFAKNHDELPTIIDCPHKYVHNYLDCSFNWSRTSQGYDYWYKVFNHFYETKERV